MDITFMDAFGIKRPSEWAVQADDELAKFLKEKEDVINQFGFIFLFREHPDFLTYMIFNFKKSQAEAFSHFAQMFILLGYLKGLADGEDRALRDFSLRKLVDG